MPSVTLEPVFVPGIQVLRLAAISVFFAIWGGGFFGGFSGFFLHALDVEVPPWLPFVFFGVAFAVGLPSWIYRATRKTYERTTYTFRPDRLDYFEGFFTVEEKSIPLDLVTEVRLRKGPFQSRHGLGTILLSTPTSCGNGRATAGIRLLGVAHPDATDRRVRELVERARAGARRTAA